MKYRFTAWDRQGRCVEEAVEASSQDDARRLIEQRGLFVSEIAGAGERRSQPTNMTRASRAPLVQPGKIRLLAVFARQLSVLVTAGTPLVDALEAVESQLNAGPFRDVVEDIRLRVEEGGSLSDAMGRHTEWFDAVSLSLAAAGESGGQLDVMLQRMATLTQQHSALRSQLVGAMVYPALLTVVAICVFVLMTVFESLDVPLPVTTALLLEFSGVLRGYWWGIVPALLAVVCGAIWWLRSERGQRALDTAMIRLPKIGGVTRSLEVARLTRLMGLLLVSKVPVVEAAQLTQTSLHNRHYRAFMDELCDRVIGGENLSSVMVDSDLIPRGVSQAVRNAERAGKMGEVMTSLADSMEEDNRVVVKSLTSIIEPLILVALGLMVGFVTLSMFLPLFDVTAAAGGPR